MSNSRKKTNYQIIETNEIKEKNDGKRTHRLAVVIGLAILLCGVFAINQALQPQEEKPLIVLEPGQTAGETSTAGVQERSFRFSKKTRTTKNVSTPKALELPVRGRIDLFNKIKKRAIAR